MTQRTLSAAATILVAALLFFASSQDLRAQQHPVCTVARSGHVVIYGDVPTEQAVPFAELETMPRTTVEASFHDGAAAAFEGVTLRELISRAGVPADLRSVDLMRYVVVEAADGYRALFAVAELDPAFREGPIILADAENGHPITAEYGPLQ